MASFAAFCAATVAAKADDLRDPAKLDFPADDQETTFPAKSVIDTIVLLKVAFTWAIPAGTVRAIFFFTSSAREIRKEVYNYGIEGILRLKNTNLNSYSIILEYLFSACGQKKP